jgi:hypothetical protein
MQNNYTLAKIQSVKRLLMKLGESICKVIMMIMTTAMKKVLNYMKNVLDMIN